MKWLVKGLVDFAKTYVSVEREKGFEPSTSTLARWAHTTICAVFSRKPTDRDVPGWTRKDVARTPGGWRNGWSDDPAGIPLRVSGGAP